VPDVSGFCEIPIYNPQLTIGDPPSDLTVQPKVTEEEEIYNGVFVITTGKEILSVFLQAVNVNPNIINIRKL
jgi:hypothetical protein